VILFSLHAILLYSSAPGNEHIPAEFVERAIGMWVGKTGLIGRVETSI
jgi:hypothetical protein